METDWNPNLEDILEQLQDGMISFEEYTNQMGNGFEAANPSGGMTIVDRLELASMIAKETPQQIGVLKTANDLINGNAEAEITKLIRMTSGLSENQHNIKMNSKFTKKSSLEVNAMKVSGTKNLFVDENFFKLTSQPSEPFFKVQKPFKKVPASKR